MGIEGILSPSIGHCPRAGSRWRWGQGLLPPEVAAERWPGGPKVALEAQPPAARERGSVFPKIHVVLAVFIQAPATSCRSQ